MNRSQRVAPFVIITPAHNEEALIERTIESMISQVVRPIEWIIVNDNSTDCTADIVRRYAGQHDFLRLVDLHRTGTRHFGNKARAFNAGLAEVKTLDHLYVGNLDADISLERDYFKNILVEFESDPRLGIAGGMVSTRIGDRFVSQGVALDSVAGAVQLFRRSCFEEIGGYLALPEGGIDSAAEIMARMRGWKVRTFPALRVLEHRRTGTATALPVAAKLKEGRRLQSLGYGFMFLFLRCVYRSLEPPRGIGSAAMLVGYLQRMLKGHPIVLPPDVVSYLRAEQQRKLVSSLKGMYVRHLRNF
ncbi:MAG: glycosyltransferase family 2 protein [Burkholderiales bacterium]|jgi:poly-beta-1,6-N-acetyl-D-glucosamine synthase|nr:glycosyltransferase family 2 protein [Burkholderiales bacterium]